MTPYPHQIKIAHEALTILRNEGLVYLAMEERTGKTLTAILMCENSKATNILVITKKKAIIGWEDTLSKFTHTKTYTIINYESLHKLPKASYDLCIIDEAHANLGAYPKLGKTWKATYKVVYGKPIIFMSATPSAQTYSQLYHQMKLSKWSPWAKYSNFYKWFEVNGVQQSQYIAGREIKLYNKTKDNVFEDVKHLFITYTRNELGFEHEPNDILHFVDLSEYTKDLYRRLEKNKVITINDSLILADTPMGLMTKLHQVEGGTIKYEEEDYILDNTEKIDYIKSMFGDSKDVVLFYHYINELKKLKQYFKQATILQATSFAEGVDLSMFKTLVVYSMDFSTARYTQRRARQCNMKRTEPIDVHFILVNKGISHQVYETVAINKKNFVNSYYEVGLI